MSSPTQQPGNPRQSILPQMLSEKAQVLRDQLQRNPRQAGVVALLGAVLLAVCGKLVIGRNSPEEAAASGLSVSAPNAAASIQEAAHHPRVVMSLSSWAAQPMVSGRNLFDVPLDYYPRDPNSPDGSHSGEEMAKFLTAKADELKERQILMDNVQQRSAALTLESTVMGDHPRAWVNGLLVGLGQTIGTTGFSIARIEPRRIFVQSEGVQVEISMK